MPNTLSFEQTDGVAIIWLNRPAVHNAFNAEVIAELDAALATMADDASLRVLVLGGRGKSFSAGADIDWMRAAGRASLPQNVEDARSLAQMLRRLATFPAPTIARVHGAALGGGMGLVAACDICIAASSAVFATSEVRLGLVPATISPYVLRAIGERQASRYFLTGERIGAERARELGLVHEVSTDEDIDVAVASMVESLMLGGPDSQVAAKRGIAEVAGRALDDKLLEHTAQRIAEVRATVEAAQGLAAFMEKRPPPWTLPADEH